MDCPILCYGAIDLDWYLAVDALPSVDHDAHVRQEIHNVGGSAANVAVWLAHWGVPVRLAGLNLGDDADGAVIRQQLARYSLLDSRYVCYRSDQPTPRCQCLVTPDGERSFISHWPDDITMTPLSSAMLTGVTWLSLDMSGVLAPRLAAAQLARAHGSSVLVNDVHSAEHPLLSHADIVVLSASLFHRKHGGSSLRELATSMTQASHCDVFVTNGSQPVWGMLNDGSEITLQPPSVPVVDTTGAGDIFKAGLLYGLLQGLSVRKSLVWAVAAATAKVGRAGTTADPAELSTLQQLALTNCEQVE